MKPVRVVLAVVLALGFEALALGELVAGAPWLALASHLAAAGLLAEALHAAGGGGRALAAGWFWCGAFPLVGVLAGVALLRRVGRPGRWTGGESREQLRARAADAALEGRKRAHRVGADLVPLAEALRDPSAGVRVAALDALRDEDAPWAVRLLQRARDNEVYDVRFRAVEALGRISSRRLDEIAAARRELRRAPSGDAHRRLARLCFDYADLALDGEEIGRSYLRQTIEHAGHALRSSPALDVELVLLVARAALGLAAYDQAAAAYARVLAVEPEHAAALAGLAEAQLQQRDFAGLSLTGARLRALGGPNPSAPWASR